MGARQLLLTLMTNMLWGADLIFLAPQKVGLAFRDHFF